jgi:hypothetical protein
MTNLGVYEAIRRALMNAENRIRSDGREAAADGETVAVQRMLNQADALSTARSVLTREDCE